MAGRQQKSTSAILDFDRRKKINSSVDNSKQIKTEVPKLGVGYAYSEDEDGSVTSSGNVSSVGLHVLPPSPISCGGSLSSNDSNP